MYRIDNSTAIPYLPVPEPSGNPGFFTDGNPAAALMPTIVDAWWANIVQEEILTVIEAAGLAADKANHTQLLEALRRMFLGIDHSGYYLPLTGGALANPGNLVIQGELHVADSAVFRHGYANIVSLEVPGSAVVGGEFHSHGGAWLNGGLSTTQITASADAHVAGNLYVWGIETGGGVAIGGGLTIAHDLRVAGHSYLDGGVTVPSLTLSGDLTVHGLAWFGNDLHLGGQAFLNSNATVQGVVRANSGRIVSQGGNSPSVTVFNTGSTSHEAWGISASGVAAQLNFGPTDGDGEPLAVYASLDGVGTFTANYALSVGGNATIAGALSVSAEAIFHNGGRALWWQVDGALTVAGEARLNGSLYTTTARATYLSITSAPGGTGADFFAPQGSPARISFNSENARIWSHGSYPDLYYKIVDRAGGSDIWRLQIDPGGTIWINGQLDVNGGAVVGGQLHNHGGAWLNGGASITTLSVSGAAGVSGQFNSHGEAVLHNGGRALWWQVDGALTVNGPTNLNGGATISSANISNGLTVNANGANISGGLVTTGGGSLGGNVTVGGNFGVGLLTDLSGPLNVYSTIANKIGGGPWLDLYSDSRVKKAVERYGRGLDEIRRLSPITYQFNGAAGSPDDGKTYHGLIAQDAVAVMPEMGTTPRKMLLAADDAEETDILGLDTAPITWALVNAVQELADRLEALEPPSVGGSDAPETRAAPAAPPARNPTTTRRSR